MMPTFWRVRAIDKCARAPIRGGSLMSRVTLVLSLVAVCSLLVTSFARAADPKPDQPKDVSGSIEVDMLGTVHTGIMAIGAETTGTTISALGFTWELDFGGDKGMIKTAEGLD